MRTVWPFSLVRRDRFFDPSRWFASPRSERAHGPHAPSQVLPSHALHHKEAHDEAHDEASEWSIHTGRTGRVGCRRWLIASVQQLYAVILALATVVVLLWRGPLVLLAAGALFLGLAAVAVAVAVFLVLARRAEPLRGGSGPHREREVQ